MTDRHDLVAYLATLGSLVVVFIAALFASGHGVTVNEAFGLGTITGGLIGILRIPTNRDVRVTNGPADPVLTEDAP